MKSPKNKSKAILKLDGPERYKHFIKVVADWEEVWSLYNDGWALGETNDGDPLFPFWPAKEYAALCAKDDWNGYEPESIPLDDFIQELLPKLKRDGVLPGIFYTPEDHCVTPTVDQLLEDLKVELEKYE